MTATTLLVAMQNVTTRLAAALAAASITLQVYPDANIAVGTNAPAAGYIQIWEWELMNETQMSRGGPQATFSGTLAFTISVFTPANAGDGAALVAAEAIALNFRQAVDGDVQYVKTSVRERAFAADDPFFQVDVDIVAEKWSDYPVAV